MKTLFHVKNTTGEAWPAFGMARLGAILRYDGVNADVPLYALVKPDDAEGIYVVNGASPLANNTEGTAIHYQNAQYVLVKETEDAGVGVTIGAVVDEWTAGSDDGNGGQFDAVDEKNAANVITVVSKATGTSVTAASVCGCHCLDEGDIIVNGVETTSKWSVRMVAEVFKQTYGKIMFPSGDYVLTYDDTAGVWLLDIGDVLTAVYLSGEDATADMELDGTLTMGFDSYGAPYISLCVEGTVPEEV